MFIEGVDNMVDEVLDQAFTGHDGLRTAAEARHHGEATVLISLSFIVSMSFLPYPIGLKAPPGYAGSPLPPNFFPSRRKSAYPWSPGSSSRSARRSSAMFILAALIKDG